jgi:hypothetical protein
MGACALELLVTLIRKDLVEGDYLQVDETQVRVMDPEVLSKSAQGWLWVYARHGAWVIFEYQGSRGREGPDRMLKDFHGAIQTDGYELHDASERDRKNLRPVAC